MNTKTLSALAIAALIAVVAAVWVSSANRPVVNEGVEQNLALLPSLRDQINEVDSIALSGAGNRALVTLKRGADGWRIVEKSNYPADLSKLREFLLKLADTTVIG